MEDISSEEEDSEDEEKVDFFTETKEEINIEEVKEGISVYESLVDSQMTSENVSGLLELLEKAI